MKALQVIEDEKHMTRKMIDRQAYSSIIMIIE